MHINHTHKKKQLACIGQWYMMTVAIDAGNKTLLHRKWTKARRFVTAVAVAAMRVVSIAIHRGSFN